MRILLVHGAGGTPATWDAVLPLLRSRGYEIATVTNPMTSLEDDIAHTTAALDALEAPVLLVGHSYGGAVITNVGRDPRVAGLVYLAAFAPDAGETVQQIVERYEPAPVSKHMRRGPDGEWRSERGDAYWAEIGWDLTDEQRAGRIAENRVADKKIFEQPTGEPAWRTLPSWYQVADRDATLLPQIQRDMAARAGATTSSVPGSHFSPLVYAAQGCAVIDAAVAELSTAGSGA
ncbi:alpha/beta hydrolase [Pseudonocardia nematodicida]|uniref:Alpha/beta hydrolase n=1 Tax=Pseudonocardia nematodicida TaxID=1206997 RepID=A0ABV1K5A3_9PSEU